VAAADEVVSDSATADDGAILQKVDEDRASQLAEDRAFSREVMARVPLLAKLSAAQLDAIVSGARIAEYAPGDILISEGEIGRRFFVLVSGECDVFELSKGLSEGAHMPGCVSRGGTHFARSNLSLFRDAPRHFAAFSFSPNAMRTAYGTLTNALEEGSYFGERGLITNEPRAATILAATKVRALAVDRSALAKADRRFEDGTRLSELIETNENFLWGYEQKQVVEGLKTTLTPSKRAAAQKPLDDDEPAPEAPLNGEFALANNPLATDLSLMQRLRLVRAVVRAFDQAAARSPKWGDAAEKKYRAGLVAQLTPYQRDEFEQTFHIIDRDGDGAITVADLAGLMTAVGRAPQDDELRSMINKANPEVEGNDMIAINDFLALMAQAEFSAMFLEAFSLLDPNGHGWVESELLWQMMNTLVPPKRAGSRSSTLAASKIDELIDIFGVSDGHIDYQAFVKIMMSSD